MSSLRNDLKTISESVNKTRLNDDNFVVDLKKMPEIMSNITSNTTKITKTLTNVATHLKTASGNGTFYGNEQEGIKKMSTAIKSGNKALNSSNKTIEKKFKADCGEASQLAFKEAGFSDAQISLLKTIGLI